DKTCSSKLIPLPEESEAIAGIDDRRYDAALVASRGVNGRLSFAFHLGETMGDSTRHRRSIGIFGVAVLDFSARNPVNGFQLPALDVLRQTGTGGAAAPYSAAHLASRLVVG